MSSTDQMGKYLLREESNGKVAMLPINGGGNIVVSAGASYTLLSPLLLQKVPVYSAIKSGFDLILTLQGGETLVLKNYFLNSELNSHLSRATFDDDLPLKLDTLDHETKNRDDSRRSEISYESVELIRQAPQVQVPLDLPYQVPFDVQNTPAALNNVPGNGLSSYAGNMLAGALAIAGLSSMLGGSDRNAGVNNTNNIGSNPDPEPGPAPAPEPGPAPAPEPGPAPAPEPNPAPASASPLALGIELYGAEIDALPEIDLNNQPLVDYRNELFDRIDALLTDPEPGPAPAPEPNPAPAPAPTSALQEGIAALRAELDALPEIDLNDQVQLAYRHGLYDRINELLSGSGGGDGTSDDSTGLGSVIDKLVDVISGLAGVSGGQQVTVNNYNGTSGTSTIPVEEPDTEIKPLSVTLSESKNIFTDGDKITFEVNFDGNVYSGNADDLTLSANDGDYIATYVSGINTDTLRFELLVDGVISETSLSLDDAPLQLNGAILTDVRGNAVTLTPFPDFSAQVTLEPQIKITEISALPSQGEYFDDNDAGTELEFFVKFSDAVSLDGDGPDLVLNTGSSAIYMDQIGPTGGNDPSILRFVYKLADEESALPPQFDIVPLAIVENNGKIRSLTGVDALVEITDAVTNSYKTNTDLRYNLAQPEIVTIEFDEIQSSPTEDQVFQSGTDPANALKVSGLVRVTYSEPVVTVINDNIDGIPQVPIFGLYNKDPDTGELLTGSASYSLDVTNNDGSVSNRVQIYEFTNLILKESDLIVGPPAIIQNAEAVVLIENGATIIGEGGVPASDQIPSDIGYIATAGAGPFFEDSITVSADYLLAADWDSLFSNEPRASVPVIVRATDVNGSDVNYVDEFTGHLVDLTDSKNSIASSLRAIVSDPGLNDDIFITPLSELHVQAVEAGANYQLSEISAISRAISDFFGVNEFIKTPPSFVNQYDDNGALLLPQNEDLAVALAVLSTMDSVSGSLWNTLTILTPVFSDKPSNEELSAAATLIDLAAKKVSSSTEPEYLDYIQEISMQFDDMNDAINSVISNKLGSEALIEDLYSYEEDLSYEIDGLEIVELISEEYGMADADLNEFDDLTVNQQVWTSDYVDVTEHKAWEYE